MIDELVITDMGKDINYIENLLTSMNTIIQSCDLQNL